MSNTEMLIFIPEGLRQWGKAWSLIYKGKQYILPKSQCIVEGTKKTKDRIIKVPKWLAEKSGLLYGKSNSYYDPTYKKKE